MDFKSEDLHMLFFPLMAPGHMLPTLDMAKLFASHNARVTILTTPNNAALLLPTLPSSIHLHTIPFPSSSFNLPPDSDSRASSLPESLRTNFFQAVASLRQPFDDALSSLLPDCVVSDMFMPWTHHLASARNIPRLVFHGTNNFALCLGDAYERCRELVGNESESFVLPGLPHRIEMSRSQVMDFRKLAGTPMEFLMKMKEEMREVEPKGFGAVMNSFYELEPEYVEHYREVMGRRSWNVGPVWVVWDEGGGLGRQEVLTSRGRPADWQVGDSVDERGELIARMQSMGLSLVASRMAREAVLIKGGVPGGGGLMRETREETIITVSLCSVQPFDPCLMRRSLCRIRSRGFR